MTTLKDLQKAGAFVAEKPIKKSIKYTLDGQDYEAEIFVKEIGVGEREALFTGDDDEKSRVAKIIAHTVLLGDGSERISYPDAFRLKQPLADAMVAACNEVNAPKKSSAGTSDSSATSA